MHSKKILIVLVATLMIFASAQTSRAALNAVDPGPYVLANGFFPAWYQDVNGLGLAPCLDLPAPLGTGFCVVLADTFFTPNSAVVFPTNWPTEFFYWIADADKNSLPAWIKIFRFAMEGAFAVVGPPTDGQQTVFQRIRFRFTPPVTGTYTITHPFGQKTFTNVPSGVEIRDTTDVPLGIALDFITALSGPEGPFLQWDPAVLPAAPAGYIGDAATPHAVIGSPTGNNFVRVDGPPGSNIGGTGIDFVGTNLFVVAGKITAVPLPTPLTVDRTTYGRTTTPAASQIDVFARSAPLATLTFNDGTVAANAMAKDTTGRFYGQSASTIPAVVPPAVHPTITVDASGAGNPSTFASNLTDVVTIAVAEYSVLGQTLTIDAASSDQVSAPVLTADATITLTPGVPTIIAGVLAPPAFVTVTSSLGGSKSVPVVILP
jgi:hypothetical protein